MLRSALLRSRLPALASRPASTLARRSSLPLAQARPAFAVGLLQQRRNLAAGVHLAARSSRLLAAAAAVSARFALALFFCGCVR